jgi:hypothetical protein
VASGVAQGVAPEFKLQHRCLWFTPIILVIQEMEIREIAIESQHKKGLAVEWLK